MVEPYVIEVGESESGFRFGVKGKKNIFLDFSIVERGNRKVGFRTQKNIFFPRISRSRVKKGVSGLKQLFDFSIFKRGNRKIDSGVRKTF